MKFRWNGEVPSPEIQKKVEEDCAGLIEGGLKEPGDLLYHTVQLTPDRKGPSVSVWGDDEEPDVFVCEYVERTKWITYNSVTGETKEV